MFQYDPYGMGGGARPRRTFEQHYQCFSMAMIDKSHLDDGDKIILPTSALNALSRMEIEYPMLFEVKNEQLNRRTHCGVIEFIAEEGKCHLPCHMMNNLLVEEGSIISIKNVSLPKATFLKVRAQSVDFLDISNPRAVLEYTLRKYTCVTTGDVIVLQHLGKLFHMDVQEVRPNGAASIVETDVEIDFDEPLGYKDSEYAKHERKGNENTKASSTNGGILVDPLQFQKARAIDANANMAPSFVPFSGTGKRIDGKATPASSGKLNNNDAMTVDPAAAAVSALGQPSSGSSSTLFSSPGLTIAAGSKTASSTSNKASADSSNQASQPVNPTYQSRIGNKYSQKKTAVSAFSGPANKLT